MVYGFSVIKELSLEFFKGKGIWLRHDRTGLNIFKFYSDKEKDYNYFSFNINTPLSDDCGIAHILEHCILQGSERFPDPELFYNLRQNTLAQTINAATQKTSTQFFAECKLKKDFYNLFEVIGDSVFFPLLTEETFLQEGWRIEFENDRPFINGIVYNEMNTDDRKSALWYMQSHKDFLSGSDEVYNPGGNPLLIPETSVDDIREFHKKYYVPANAFLTLVGDLDLDEQLKFLDEKLLSRLPSGTELFLTNDNITPFTETKHFTYQVFHNGTDDPSLILKFCTVDGDFDENNFRDEVFNLIIFSLNEEVITPKFGTSISMETYGTSKHRMFSIVIDNVPENQIEDAKKYLLSLFENMAQNGIERHIVEMYCYNNDICYEDDEFALQPETINDCAFASWRESNDPFNNLIDPSEFWPEIKEKFLNPKDKLFENFIKTYLTENPHKAFFTLIPDEKYFDKINRDQELLFEKILNKSDIDELKSKAIKFQKYEEKLSTEKDKSIVPGLEVKDLPEINDVQIADHEEYNGSFGKIHLFSSVQDFNKKSCFSIYFPADVLTPEELYYFNEGYMYINGLGFAGKSLLEARDLLDDATVEFKSFTMTVDEVRINCDASNEYENRLWYAVSFSILNRNIEKGLKLIQQFLFDKNYSNDELKVLKNKFKKSTELSCKTSAPVYGMNYIQVMDCDKGLIDYYLNGFNTPERKKQIAEEDIDSVFDKIIKSYKKVISSGALFNYFGSAEQNLETRKHLIQFIEQSEICSLKDKIEINTDSFRKQLKLPEKNYDKKEINTVYCNYQNSSAMATFPCSLYSTKEYTAEEALLCWFQSSELFTQLRIKAGIYCFTLYMSPMDGKVKFFTDNDPNPEQSMTIFTECLETINKLDFDEETVKQIIIKCYSDTTTKISPYLNGKTCFERHLTDLKPEYKINRIKDLLRLTEKDLKDAAERIYTASRKLKGIILTNNADVKVGKLLAEIN